MSLNRFIFVSTDIFILYWTILKRTEGPRDVSFIPFYSFIEARASSERYRSLVANILMFIPFGLCLPLSFRKQRHMYTTIISAFALSVVIELVQYIWGLGLCETDDVICNTIGASCGTLASVCAEFCRKKAKHQRK